MRPVPKEKKYTLEQFMTQVCDGLGVNSIDYLSSTELRAAHFSYDLGRSSKVIIRSIQRFRRTAK